MTRATSTMAIARLWAAGFVDSRPIQHWVRETYGKPFSITVGADMRRPPEASQAPFIALFPDERLTGPQRESLDSRLGLVVGVVEEDWIEREGYAELVGLGRLDEVCPLLEDAMRFALPKARLQEVTVAYELALHPLCMAVYTVSVRESLPVGGRNP